jgi:hypothetical protein
LTRNLSTVTGKGFVEDDKFDCAVNTSRALVSPLPRPPRRLAAAIAASVTVDRRA